MLARFRNDHQSYDMDGRVYSRLRGENRILIESGKISPSFRSALLAREDSRFYEHHGIDPVGIGRALLRDVAHLRVREGGSTITQQLARNSFPLGGRNLSRKILEAFVALRIEASYSKPRSWNSTRTGFISAQASTASKPLAKLISESLLPI